MGVPFEGTISVRRLRGLRSRLLVGLVLDRFSTYLSELDPSPEFLRIIRPRFDVVGGVFFGGPASDSEG